MNKFCCKAKTIHPVTESHREKVCCIMHFHRMNYSSPDELATQNIHYNFILPASLVANVANATTETELIGIKIAAITGESNPDSAIEIPITL